MKNLSILIFALLLAFTGGGCATNYRLEAVKKARLYALDKYPDLSDEAVHYIRFTAPEIRQDLILHETDEYTHGNFAQTCLI